MGSYENSYGDIEWNLLYEDGITPAFTHFDDAAYLRAHPEQESPFLSFSNGKNDGGIGWAQAVHFVQALRETKRPFCFYFGMGGHGERALNPPNRSGQRLQDVNPIDIRTNLSLPAFNHCSLDDHPGNGDPSDGDASGQINAYLYWESSDILDTAEAWEMTMGVVPGAPANSCTVSLTPRRLQSLQSAAGMVFQWTNTDLQSDTVIQSGSVIADAHAHITLDGLILNAINPSGGGNRIRIEANDPANQAPELAPIGNRCAPANQALEFAIQASDADDDPLEYSASNPE
jgi:hypothetical protein